MLWSCSRLAKRRKLAIMAEVTREDVRERLHEATSITVALDESDGRKIFRARCDTPTHPYRYDCVLGVLTKRFGEFERVVDEAREDHAVLTHKYLESFHKRFFTPDVGVMHYHTKPPQASAQRSRQPAARGGPSQPAAAEGSRQPAATQRTCQPAARDQPPAPKAVARAKKRQREPVLTKLDDDAHNSYRQKVRVLASDGGAAERRALFFSAAGEYYPNAAMAIKDMTHTIRIATAKPMQMVGVYAEVSSEILNKKHALIPDISNSNKWQNMLQGIQQEVLQIPSLTLPGCLKVVLRHLQFAKQRMDSTADPLAKVCLMLLPIALLLASMSSDERRTKEQRERASHIMSLMQPKFLHAMGVSADWGILCIGLLRLFDACNHDIANSADELDDFEEVIKCVFVNGGVFQKAPVVSASGGVDADAEFITSRVRKQVLRPCVFRCGATQRLVWGPLKEHDLKELTMNTRVAAQVMLERLRADATGLRRDFACFSLRRVSVALGGGAASGATMLNSLLAAVKNLGRAFRLDKRILELEYADALPVVLREWRDNHSTKKQNGKSFPNEIVWQKLLEMSFVEKEFPSRRSAFVVLPVLLRIWFSILDGESMVERDFAHVRDFVRSSKIKNSILIDDMVVLKLSGPQDPQELAQRSASGDLVATAFLIRCVEKWRRLYGSRYGLQGRRQATRKVKQVTKKHRPTFADVKRGVLRVAHRVTVAARRSAPEATNAYGVSAGFFRAPQWEKKEKTSVWNDKLKRFNEDTKKKKLNNERFRFGRSAFPKWKERSGYQAATPHPSFFYLAFLPDYDVAACGASSEKAFVDMGYQVQEGVDRCEFAQLVIIDSLERFHGPCPSAEWLPHLTYIVSKGITVTTAASCASVGGNVRRLRRSEFVEHRAASEEEVAFSFEEGFARRHPEVVAAVRTCASPKTSKWRVEKVSKKAASGASGSQRRQPPVQKKNNKIVSIEVAGLESMWQSLLLLRRVRNTKAAPLAWQSDRVYV